MLVGVLSDTHIAFPRETLPPQIKDVFGSVDLILHAGDIWVPSVLDELESIAPVMATWGDDDWKEDLGNDKRMMKGHALELEGVTLWVTHIKPPYTLYGGNVVVFGHTHAPTVARDNGTLLVNPGSATLPGYVPKLGTVALLDINSGRAEAHIVQLG